MNTTATATAATVTPVAVKDLQKGMVLQSTKNPETRYTLVALTPRPGDKTFKLTMLNEATQKRSYVDYAADKLVPVRTESVPATEPEVTPAPAKKRTKKVVEDDNMTTCDRCGNPTPRDHNDELDGCYCEDCTALLTATPAFARPAATEITFKGPRTMIWFALAAPSVAYAASKGVKLTPVPGWGARLEGPQVAVEGVSEALTAAWATVGDQLRAWAKTNPEGREDPNIADALKAVELLAEALA